MKEIKIYCLEHFEGFAIAMTCLVLLASSVVFFMTMAFDWSGWIALGAAVVFWNATWTSLIVAGGYLEHIEDEWWDKAQALRGEE